MRRSARARIRARRPCPLAAAALLVAAVAGAAPVHAGPEEEFARGTTIVGVQVNGGAQNNIQRERSTSGITFVGVQPRLSYLPFEPFGSGWYAAALEPGVEGWAQYYLGPQKAVAGGAKASLRLHALGLGPFVPYLEGTAGAGATGLDLPESRSTFTFILEAGAGVSYFVARAVALNVGYRLQHLSNGNTSSPNRGYNAHTGVAGVSFFFR